MDSAGTRVAPGRGMRPATTTRHRTLSSAARWAATSASSAVRRAWR